MNFKKTTMTAALAVAVMTAGALATSSVEAATITAGSKLNLSSPNGGGVNFLTSPTPKVLDFFSGISKDGQRVGVDASTGTFLGATSRPKPPARIKDLDLTLLSGNLYKLTAPVNNFLRGIDIVGGPSTGNDVQFDLTKFIFDKATGESTAFEGVFTSGTSSIKGIGRFTSQTDLGNPSSYSLSITAVPTPALLPGLIAMGVGMMRKRKAEAVES